MGRTQTQKHLDQSTSSRQCVFRCGQSWYSVPATSLRSVTIGSSPFRTPSSPSWLDGIVHFQSEFIPVIALNSYLDRQPPSNGNTSSRLLILNSNPAWAIRADEIAALADIESSLSLGHQVPTGKHSGVVGTFTWSNHIARVLEPHNLLTQIQRALHEYWSQPTDDRRHTTSLPDSPLLRA